MKKIVIIGCGNVGISYLRKICYSKGNYQISLIDVNDHIKGEIIDLLNSLVYSNNNKKLKIGTFAECNEADLIVITAGVKQTTNDRLLDIVKCKKIIKDITDKLKKTKFNGIYLIASNPIDVITTLFWHYTNYPSNKIIGTGTMLDTIRAKMLIGKKLNVKPSEIDLCVLGEHGNSQFISWSNARFATFNLNKYFSTELKNNIEKATKSMASYIIKYKGYTSEGISSCLFELTMAIFNNLLKVYPISNYNENYGIYLSTPCIIGGNGIEKVIDIKLSIKEKEKLNNSANTIKEVYKKALQ